jgi:hypothetical protein
VASRLRSEHDTSRRFLERDYENRMVKWSFGLCSWIVLYLQHEIPIMVDVCQRMTGQKDERIRRLISLMNLQLRAASVVVPPRVAKARRIFPLAFLLRASSPVLSEVGYAPLPADYETVGLLAKRCRGKCRPMNP